VSDRLPVQLDYGIAGRSLYVRKLRGDDTRGPSVPRELAEAAWQGYDADGHGEQSCERMHQRGGFSIWELGYYLARAVDEGRVEIRLTDRARVSG
jgi:hypothetical protein